MRHGAVEYFADSGRPHHPDHVPLTPQGVAQAQAMGTCLARAGVVVDRVICSGLARTRSTAEHVMAAAGWTLPLEEWPEWQEIRGGRLGAIPQEKLRDAFIAPFRGAVPLDTPFLGGETIGQLLERAIPALERLLADRRWDSALLVLHGGVNRALLSWLLSGQRVFFGGFEQAPGCLNVVDVGTGATSNILRVLNYSPLDALHTSTRLSTMELLYARYQAVRGKPSAEE